MKNSNLLKGDFETEKCNCYFKALGYILLSFLYYTGFWLFDSLIECNTYVFFYMYYSMAILFMAWYITVKYTHVNVCSNASFSHFGLLITAAIVEC